MVPANSWTMVTLGRDEGYDLLALVDWFVERVREAPNAQVA
jgi:hypothetical protein